MGMTVIYESESSKTNQCQNTFNPYEYTSGTIMTLAPSSDYALIASDTRLNSEYNFYTRTHSKIYKINDRFTLVGDGFDADLYQLSVNIKHSIVQYEQMHDIKISLDATAHCLMNILYSRRLFPYYTFVCLVGNDGEKVEIVKFDCVGSYEKTKGCVYGTGQVIVQPLLDSLLKGDKSMDVSAVKEIASAAFQGTAERDVKTGDFVEIVVIHKNGHVDVDVRDLRKD